MNVIMWHGRYVCGAPQMNSSPELTDDPAEAYVFINRAVAQQWLDDYYDVPAGQPFSIVGDTEIRIEEHAYDQPARS